MQQNQASVKNLALHQISALLAQSNYQNQLQAIKNLAHEKPSKNHFSPCAFSALVLAATEEKKPSTPISSFEAR